MKETEELLVSLCDLKLYFIYNKTITTTTKAGGAGNKNQCLDPEYLVRKRKKQANKQKFHHEFEIIQLFVSLQMS